MKVYIVTNYADGEDFTGETTIIGVFAKKTDAKKAFKKEVQDWKKYSAGNSYDEDSDVTSYEITDFDSDYHAVVKIEEKEVQ